MASQGRVGRGSARFRSSSWVNPFLCSSHLKLHFSSLSRRKVNAFVTQGDGSQWSFSSPPPASNELNTWGSCEKHLEEFANLLFVCNLLS